MYDKKCNRSVFLRILPGQTHNDKLMGQIKRICRFVQQQDLGTQYKRLRHEHKLFLTAAQAAYRFSTQAIKPKPRRTISKAVKRLVTDSSCGT